MREVTLSPTSYVVLGFLAMAGEATPYDLKRMVAGSVGHFWSIPHSQLYAEPARLAEAGYVSERRERGGRRRRHYSLTAAGRDALERWVADATDELVELRDPGLLKLFFGAEPELLAPVQLSAHKRRLEAYEAMRGDIGDERSGPARALEAGIGHEREYVRFWSRLASPLATE